MILLTRHIILCIWKPAFKLRVKPPQVALQVGNRSNCWPNGFPHWANDGFRGPTSVDLCRKRKPAWLYFRRWKPKSAKGDTGIGWCGVGANRTWDDDPQDQPYTHSISFVTLWIIDYIAISERWKSRIYNCFQFWAYEDFSCHLHLFRGPFYMWLQLLRLGKWGCFRLRVEDIGRWFLVKRGSTFPWDILVLIPGGNYW